MTILRYLPLLIGSWALCSADLVARPVDLSAPNNSLGSANLFGYLRIWRELGEVDFGNDLTLPLRLEFSSEYEKPSPYFGKGWSCPLLEANAYLSDEKMMVARLPCGKTMYLRRDKKDPAKFHSLDKEWNATVDPEKIVVSRDDGWELRYLNGHLARMKTDKGRILSWVKRGDLVSEIREEGGGVAALKVETTSAGKPAGLSVNGKSHVFELGKRPKVEVANGANVIGGFQETLTGWKFPDGKQEKYEFAVNEKVLPTIKITDTEQQEAGYGWDPASRHIVSDGEWTYRIEPKNDSTVPKLYRQNDSGEDEYLFINSKSGLTERKSIGEGTRIVEVFKTPGPLYNKVRSIRAMNNNDIMEVVYKANYDNLGRVIRETFADGLTRNLVLNSEGKIVRKEVQFKPDSQKIAAALREEKSLLEAISKTQNVTDSDSALLHLGIFYAQTLHDSERAQAIVGKLFDHAAKFNLSVHIILSNESLAEAQQADMLEKLLALFPEKSQFLNSIIQDKRGIKAPDLNGSIVKVITSN